MPFFVSSPVSDTATVFIGGSNTVGLPGNIGWRVDYEDWLELYKSDTSSSLAKGGMPSWYGLLEMNNIVAANPTHVVIEFATNDSQYPSLATSRTNGWLTAAEALVVKLRTELPNTRLLFVSVVGVDDYMAQIRIDSRNEWVAITDHHGISMPRLDDAIIAIYGGTPTQGQHDLYTDGVHLTELGHHTLFDEVEDVPLTIEYTGSPGWTGSLADYQPYLYDDVADWLADPILRDGTDNDGETGTGWSTNGTARLSSTADDTISWTGTITAFGLDVVENTCTFAYSIDGGAYTEVNHSSASSNIRPLKSIARGEHTITIKVVSGTVEITRFLAT